MLVTQSFANSASLRLKKMDCFYSRYDPDLDKWQKIAAMNSKRIGVGVAVVNRLLYAVGGFDGQNRLRSVECYNPDKDEWHHVAPMNTTRSGAGNANIMLCPVKRMDMLAMSECLCLTYQLRSARKEFAS